ncbi:MAG: aminoglycoside phosphotransferase family protein [Acidimicrobiia bacterium]|nr:aminoglycoside phosphotransferase family protein [Acidimicrobiia bacterium]
MSPLIPSSLQWLESHDEGRSWLAALPAAVDEVSERWGLDLGQPFTDSYVSLVLPARNKDVVAKIQFPDREGQHEAAALRLWDGNGAVLLLDHWEERNAMLLERCIPGTQLSQVGAAGLDVMIDLLPRLWVPASEPYGSLAAEVDHWVAALPQEYETAGEPFERGLLEDAIDVLLDLAGSQGEQVLLHQDLHGDNVLRAQREPWLAIDPKPLTGEREFGLSPIIRSDELGDEQQAMIHRLDRVTGELGLDRERARLWAFGHAISWGFEAGKVLPGQIEAARWLLAA